MVTNREGISLCYDRQDPKDPGHVLVNPNVGYSCVLKEALGKLPPC